MMSSFVLFSVGYNVDVDFSGTGIKSNKKHYEINKRRREKNFKDETHQPKATPIHRITKSKTRKLLYYKTKVSCECPKPYWMLWSLGFGKNKEPNKNISKLVYLQYL